MLALSRAQRYQKVARVAPRHCATAAAALMKVSPRAGDAEVTRSQVDVCGGPGLRCMQS
jgi:hypothetical protein